MHIDHSYAALVVFAFSSSSSNSFPLSVFWKTIHLLIKSPFDWSGYSTIFELIFTVSGSWAMGWKVIYTAIFHGKGSLFWLNVLPNPTSSNPSGGHTETIRHCPVVFGLLQSSQDTVW